MNTRRFIVIGQSRRMVCTFWLNVQKVSECYSYVNELFRLKGWGEPAISIPIEVESADNMQLASNDDGVCKYLGVDMEVAS